MRLLDAMIRSLCHGRVMLLGCLEQVRRSRNSHAYKSLPLLPSRINVSSVPPRSIDKVTGRRSGRQRWLPPQVGCIGVLRQASHRSAFPSQHDVGEQLRRNSAPPDRGKAEPPLEPGSRFQDPTCWHPSPICLHTRYSDRSAAARRSMRRQVWWARATRRDAAALQPVRAVHPDPRKRWSHYRTRVYRECRFVARLTDTTLTDSGPDAGRRILAGVATLLVAVFVLLPFAQNPGRLINRHPYSNRDGLAWELSPDHCASIGLFEDRNRADFWTVEALSAPSPRLVVRPKNDTAAGCPSLAHAMFSVWIGWAAETRLVAAPPTQGPMGVYTFSSFPPPVTSASSRGTITARFRVRLEFGYYPGGDTGQPCGAHECLPEHLEHVGIKFSGQEILDRLGSRPSLILDVASPPALAPPRVCSSLDPLPLSYRPGHDLFAFVDSTGHPCNIRRVGDQLPYSPRLRWIHFQGDSNSRYLVFELAKMLGLTASITHVETQHSNLPTTAVFHDGTGTGVVLVFRWVFLEHWDSDVDFLARVQLTSLRAFLESIPFPRSTKWPSTFLHPGLRPTDLFISFGSHAQRLSRSGFQAAVDRLRPGLSRCSRLSRSTYFLLTAAAEPLDIPERFVGDELMRNNRIIHVQNDVARHFVREHFPHADIIDFFTLTRTIPRSLRLDSVHFMPDVYRVQADLIWTAMIAADERHSSP